MPLSHMDSGVLNSRLPGDAANRGSGYLVALKDRPVDRCSWPCPDRRSILDFMIWSLPEFPVAMDGRTNLHGDERVVSSMATWNGSTAWKKDPELLRARLIIAQTGKLLTHLIRDDPRYRLVYEDTTAAVFVVDGRML